MEAVRLWPGFEVEAWYEEEVRLCEEETEEGIEVIEDSRVWQTVLL